jgi:UDP-N-acetylglucosamine diphosphorylase / glucose-1-phosphate thymidylyltransferase / UDP-N-acetylgalactosamine diphosphorylase / glucosamine-1-phosphate N-acetyltransferase / galactosamine-1-phosphate N-acetyltransferase
MFSPTDFFDYSDWEHQELFSEVERIWEVLPKLKPYLQSKVRSNLIGICREGPFLSHMVVFYQGNILEKRVSVIPGDATKGQFRVFYENQELKDAIVLFGGVTLVGEGIYLGEGTVVETGAYIQGPTYIGRQTEVRQGAYLRGGCLVGDHCVVGHVTEMKNSIMLDGAKAGHFAYIGDSLLGKKCNLGAGTKLANLKMINNTIQVKGVDRIYDTGLRKFGAVLGDHTETGCNSVTNPGTLLGPRSLVGPNATVKAGFYPRRSVIR